MRQRIFSKLYGYGKDVNVMKRNAFVCVCLCVLLLAGCTAKTSPPAATASLSSTQLPVTSAADHTDELSIGNLSDSTGSNAIRYAPQDFFDQMLRSSYCIVRGELVEQKEVPSNDTRYKSYANELCITEVIKGELATDTITFMMEQDITYDSYRQLIENYVPLEKGAECIVVLQRLKNVYKGTDMYLMGTPPILLDAQGNIAEIYSHKEKLDLPIKNVSEFKEYATKFVSLEGNGNVWGNEYILQRYIENIVPLADCVLHVKANSVKTPGAGDTTLYLCTMQEALKGTDIPDEIAVTTTKNAMEPGKEYLVLVMREPNSDMAFHVAAELNSVIPIEDTERVNKVYELLGKQKP